MQNSIGNGKNRIGKQDNKIPNLILAGITPHRPIHVAFLRYSDKMKILRNAAVRLKENLLNGNVIGISEDYAKKNPTAAARARALQKVSKEEAWRRPESLYRISGSTEICRCQWPPQNRRNRRTSTGNAFNLFHKR